MYLARFPKVPFKKSNSRLSYFFAFWLCLCKAATTILLPEEVFFVTFIDILSFTCNFIRDKAHLGFSLLLKVKPNLQYPNFTEEKKGLFYCYKSFWKYLSNFVL